MLIFDVLLFLLIVYIYLLLQFMVRRNLEKKNIVARIYEHTQTTHTITTT